MSCASINVFGGCISLIDQEKLESVVAHRWHRSGYKGRYVATSINGKTVYLHRFVTNAPDGIEIDHISGDTMDNRSCNLRLATRSQNEQNKIGKAKSKTGYRGVYLHPYKNRPYKAEVMVNKKKISLGYYASAEEASLAAAEGRRKYMTHAKECAA